MPDRLIPAAGWAGCLLGLAAALLAAAGRLEALAAHAAGALLVATAATSAKRRPGRGWFEFGAALLLPALGAPFVWAHAVAERRAGRGRVLKRYHEAVDGLRHVAEEDWRRPPVPQPLYLAPLADILASNASDDDKRLAIEGLSRLETPDAIEALRAALSQQSTEVRFYAASVLARIEERLAFRMENAEAAVAARPSAAASLDAARACIDVAWTGAVDPQRRRESLERAVHHTRIAAAGRIDPTAHLLLGRALLGLDEAAEAEREFSAFLALAPDDARGRLWRAEARWRLGLYPGVREDCAAASRLGGVPERMAPVVHLWNPPAPAAG